MPCQQTAAQAGFALLMGLQQRWRLGLQRGLGTRAAGSVEEADWAHRPGLDHPAHLKIVYPKL